MEISFLEVAGSLSEQSFAGCVREYLGKTVSVRLLSGQLLRFRLENCGRDWLGGSLLQVPTRVQFVAVLFRAIAHLEFTGDRALNDETGHRASVSTLLQTWSRQQRRCRLWVRHEPIEATIVGIYRDCVSANEAGSGARILIPLANLAVVELL